MSGTDEILLRRSWTVVVEPSAPDADATAATDRRYVATLAKNLESIGFAIEPPLAEVLATWPPERLLEWSTWLIPRLLKAVGGDVSYRPMYPNFPRQVMEADEAELYLNACWHYFGDQIGVRILPEYERRSRPPLEVAKPDRVLRRADSDATSSLLGRLVTSTTSLSATDRDDVRTLTRDAVAGGRWDQVKPAEIPFKETAALVGACLLRQTGGPTAWIDVWFKTPTDMLRLAVEYSGGDASLAAATRFVSMPRRVRRVLVGRLDRIVERRGVPATLEDLFRHRGAWLRLGERLHPREMAGRFPRAAGVFADLRSGRRPVTFASRLEASIASGDRVGAADLASQRPGELSRRIDHLIRGTDAETAAAVAERFAAVAAEVSTPVLLQLHAHLAFRRDDDTPRRLSEVDVGEQPKFFAAALRKLIRPTGSLPATGSMRTVFPKGQLGKLIRIPFPPDGVDRLAAAAVVETIESTLVDRFSSLPPLGRCYVDPELDRFPVPMAQRSASKSLRTLARGSRLDLPPDRTVRFFLWWKEGKVDGKPTGRVDLDLSATMYTDRWRYRDHISYTRLRSESLGCVHSGDITSAPDGACEFIDIDTRAASAGGVRYVVCSVMGFTSHAFADLPQCHAGWMSREKPESGEMFEPSTVRDKIDLTGDTRISVPVVIDLAERQVVWSDLALRHSPDQRVNVESNRRGLVHYGVAMTTSHPPNLRTLFELHVRARGSSVPSTAEADHLFSLREGVTPFDVDQIRSDYLVTADGR